MPASLILKIDNFKPYIACEYWPQILNAPHGSKLNVENPGWTYKKYCIIHEQIPTICCGVDDAIYSFCLLHNIILANKIQIKF